MSADILVFVNQPFHNDPRVNRAVQSLGRNGYCITVASGTLERPVPSPEDHAWGRVYYLRTFKAGQIGWSRGLTRFAATETKRGDISTNGGSGWYKQFFRSLLYLGQLINYFQLNVRLIIRCLGLRTRLYYPNDIDVAGAAAVLAWLHQKPLLYETHEFHTDQSAAHPNWYRRVLLFWEGLVSKRAIKVIVVGEHIARLIQEQYQLGERPAVIRSCPPYQDVARPLEPPDYPIKLLYHGVYQPKRGLEYLILAMHQIDKAHLHLRGYGHWEQPLRNLVIEEGLEGKVTFLPPVPMQELVEKATSFDVGVGAFQDTTLSSRYCLPNKIFEFMMAGLALAVSDLPELRRIVNDYNVGVTFDPADPVDIAQQINRLLVDPERLRQMQVRSLEVARDVFNFEQEGEKLCRIVGDIIGPPVQKNTSGEGPRLYS